MVTKIRAKGPTQVREQHIAELNIAENGRNYVVVHMSLYWRRVVDSRPLGSIVPSHFERRELRRADQLVELEPQVFDILLHLIRNGERVVSKDELIAAIGGSIVILDEIALSSALRRTRLKGAPDIGWQCTSWDEAFDKTAAAPCLQGERALGSVQ